MKPNFRDKKLFFVFFCCFFFCKQGQWSQKSVLLQQIQFIRKADQVLLAERPLESLYLKGILLLTKKKKTHIAIRIPWTLYTHHLVSGSIPGQGIKIPQAMWYDQKKKR